MSFPVISAAPAAPPHREDVDDDLAQAISARRSERPGSMSGMPRARYGERTISVPFVTLLAPAHQRGQCSSTDSMGRCPGCIGEDLGDHVPETAGWSGFDPQLIRSAFELRLCQVCGHEVDRDQVMIHLIQSVEGWKITSLNRSRRRRSSAVTSGSGCHPRCAMIALAMCPSLSKELERAREHWSEDQVCIGWSWSGPGQGIQDVGLHGVEGSRPIRQDRRARLITLAQLRELAG